MLNRLIACGVIAAMSSLPALAQQTPSGATSDRRASTNYNVGDPNERICEKQSVIGSRLSSKKVCATRAEWAERQRADREVTEAAQKSVCVKQAGC